MPKQTFTINVEPNSSLRGVIAITSKEDRVLLSRHINTEDPISIEEKRGLVVALRFLADSIEIETLPEATSVEDILSAMTGEES